MFEGYSYPTSFALGSPEFILTKNLSLPDLSRFVQIIRNNINWCFFLCFVGCWSDVCKQLQAQRSSWQCEKSLISMCCLVIHQHKSPVPLSPFPFLHFNSPSFSSILQKKILRENRFFLWGHVTKGQTRACLYLAIAASLCNFCHRNEGLPGVVWCPEPGPKSLFCTHLVSILKCKTKESLLAAPLGKYLL